MRGNETSMPFGVVFTVTFDVVLDTGYHFRRWRRKIPEYFWMVVCRILNDVIRHFEEFILDERNIEIAKIVWHVGVTLEAVNVAIVRKFRWIDINRIIRALRKKSP